MKLHICGLLVVVCIALISTTQALSGFNTVVTKLAGYQTPNGGFRGTDGKASLEATSNALLLANLYHLQSKVNTTTATAYIKSCENSDGGYGPYPGSPSDVESVRNALQALQNIGGKPTNPTNVINYIKGLLDKNNNLFAVRSGDKGTVKGTALALQSLESLGEIKQKWVQDTFPKIKEFLNKHRPTGEVLFFSFPEEKDAQLTANYYGIVVGQYVGFDFGVASKWAGFIQGLQSQTGQFFDSSDKKATSLGSTAHALLSLTTLGALKGAEKFVDSIKLDSLKDGVRHIANDLSAAAHAHSSLALTKNFKDFFNTVVSHDSDSDYVIEGSNYKPSLSLQSVFGDSSTHPHGGFDVSSSTTFHGKEETKGKLTWDQSLQRYVSEHLPTLGNFGPVKTAFNFAHKVAGLGDLSFSLDDLKNIGYGINVISKASLDGKDVKEGETVSANTEFKFTVSLTTHKDEDPKGSVTLTVLDSSNTVVHTEKRDAKPFTFTYRLAPATVLPPGQLAFRFDVTTGAAAHTTKTVKYQYTVPLVASNIVFEGAEKGKAPVFKLGDKVKITFEPAAFPDLRTVVPLPAKDADARRFQLDIKSPQGVLINTVPSAAAKGSSKYTFEYTIEPTLDNIGTSVLSFRYVPAGKEGDAQSGGVDLQNYDSAHNELFEDSQLLHYTVKTDLVFADTKAPKAGEHSYGGLINYRFRVRDNVSGKDVLVGPKALSNIFLNLNHDDAGRLYNSLKHPARLIEEGKNKLFGIDWTINPNAIRGSGDLSLSVVDVDGNVIPIKDNKPTKINVGGDIEIQKHTYATSVHTARHTAIIAEFELSCKKSSLKDADLTVQVVRPGDNGDVIIGTVPAAHNNGRYTVSWTAPHKEIPSANYKLLFYRNVDITRASERRDVKAKKDRKERELKGDKSPVVAAEEGLGIEPLFVVDVPYSAPRFVTLPVRAEFLALVSLAGFLVWLSVKKSNLK